MVWPRAAGGYQVVANAARKRQVRERSMQVAELAAAKSELDSAEAMIVRRHPVPVGDRCPHSVDWMSLVLHNSAESYLYLQPRRHAAVTLDLKGTRKPKS